MMLFAEFENNATHPTLSRKKLPVNLLFIIHDNRYPTLVYLSQCKFNTFILKVNRSDCIPKKTHKRSIYSQDSGVPKAPCKRGYIQGNPRGFLGSQKLKTIWNLVGNLAYGRLGSSPLGCLRIPSWGDHCHWVGGTPKKIPQNSFRIQYTKPPICFATFGVFRRSCSP